MVSLKRPQNLHTNIQITFEYSIPSNVPTDTRPDFYQSLALCAVWTVIRVSSIINRQQLIHKRALAIDIFCF